MTIEMFLKAVSLHFTPSSVASLSLPVDTKLLQRLPTCVLVLEQFRSAAVLVSKVLGFQELIGKASEQVSATERGMGA